MAPPTIVVTQPTFPAIDAGTARMLKQILCAAALAGMLSGLLLTAIEQIKVVPLLVRAEAYEAAGAAGSAGSTRADSASGRPHGRWVPAGGWGRVLRTAIANVILGIGFALLLGAAIALRDRAGWRAGLLWGVAGYTVFFVAPSLGLPPDLPGMATAPLAERQQWWLMTVTFSAAGLWAIAFHRHWLVKLLGLALLVAPHRVGAPQPEIHSSAVPADLAQGFVYATAIANALFWLALGGLLAFFYKKFSVPSSSKPDHPPIGRHSPS